MICLSDLAPWNLIWPRPREPISNKCNINWIHGMPDSNSSECGEKKGMIFHPKPLESTSNPNTLFKIRLKPPQPHLKSFWMALAFGPQLPIIFILYFFIIFCCFFFLLSFLHLFTVVPCAHIISNPRGLSINFNHLGRLTCIDFSPLKHNEIWRMQKLRREKYKKGNCNFSVIVQKGQAPPVIKLNNILDCFSISFGLFAGCPMTVAILIKAQHLHSAYKYGFGYRSGQCAVDGCHNKLMRTKPDVQELSLKFNQCDVCWCRFLALSIYLWY